MDKAEAISYIYSMLDKDHTRDEIISGLVDQLHAPEAMISKFVEQTEAEYRKSKPQTVQPTISPLAITLPPWLDELSIKPQSAEVDTQASSTLTLPTSETEIEKSITNITEAEDFVRDEYAKGRSRHEIATELAMRTGEPQTLTEKFVTLKIIQHDQTHTQGKLPIPSKKPPTNLKKPEFVNYVVSELAKHRKRNDIIKTLCERTGAPWGEAQRFVGQVNAEQHTTINTRMNRLIIPMCILAIVLGFLFTIGTIYPLFYEIAGRTDDLLSLIGTTNTMNEYVNAAPYIFFTGIALLVGGIIGLIMAMKTQIE